MKIFLLYFLYGFPLVVTAQETIYFDTTIINTSSSIFFRENQVVDFITFTLFRHGEMRIIVYPKKIWKDSSYFESTAYGGEYYDFNSLGDDYLFEKKYGKIKLPLEEVALIIKKSCSPSHTLDFTIYADSIKAHLESYCATKDTDKIEDYDFVYTPTEKKPRFKKGITYLQSQLEYFYKNRLYDVEVSPLDSVLIYKILVDRKDSCLKSIELIEGRYSPFEELITEKLKHSCSWQPAMQGGRSVMSFTKIFIRLNRDRSLTVGI